jgi:hypothetical protein
MSKYVVIERREEFQQVFDGKLVEPAVFQRRDGGLRDAEQGGNFAVFQVACVESSLTASVRQVLICRSAASA